MRKTLLVAAAALSAMLAAGCGDDAPKGGGKKPAAGKKEILVYCGAGLRPPCAELAAAFEKKHGVKVVTDYAGSEVLLSKLRLARKGDVYMPGDRHYVDQAAEKGMITSQKSVCYFVPTIFVRKGNPKKIKGLDDLIRPGTKLGLGNEKACAIGRKSKKIFKKNGIAWADVEKNLKYRSLTVNELGMQIQAKSLDAVIVWDAVAKQYSKHGEEVPIPAEKNVISTVDAGVLKFASDRGTAEKFVEFASSERGLAIFKKHGYRTEPPK